MKEKDLRRLMEKYGIRNEKFISDFWARIGSFADVMSENDLESVLLMFVRELSEQRRKELREI